MIWPDTADLVVVAGTTLGMGTASALDLLNATAAEVALAEAQAGGAGRDPASGAAALLHALLHHHPFRSGNSQVAVAATLQFLSLNGWQADLGPPDAVRAVIGDLATGSLTAADFAAWLAPRLSRDSEPITKEAPMRGWIPGRTRPARSRPPGPTFERFTGRARRVVVLAQDEARRLGHNYIGTEHILLGLLAESNGVAARALDSLGIGLAVVRQHVEEIIGRGRQPASAHIPFTPRAKNVVDLSLREAMQLGHLSIGTEHILLGLIRQGDGVAAQVLTKLGAGHGQARQAVLQLLASRETAHGEAVPPPGLRGYEEKIAELRHQKDAAIDAQDFELAATLRDGEKRLLAKRAVRITQWSAGMDVAALGEELDRLHDEVARLHDLLLQHGIEPGETDTQTA
jgi:prophage maintenance system killer protein